MALTDQQLQDLPESRGFRLRGAEMTRLETFVDAAFAFAVTMVVISVNEIPSGYGELLEALKRVPAFATSFTLIMMFWFAHRSWSRRFGLEDGRSIALSLGLIFVMLVYVFPLRLMFSAFFAWISGGWLQSDFIVHSIREITGLFVVYGIGYFAMAGSIALLYGHAGTAAGALRLDAAERVMTEQQTVSWTVQAATGLASAAFAGLLPVNLGIWAGFVYCTLPVTMTWIARRYVKKIGEVEATM